MIIHLVMIGLLIVFGIFSYFVRKVFTRKKRHHRYWIYRIIDDPDIESDTYWYDMLFGISYYVDKIGRKLLMVLMVLVLGANSIIGIVSMITSEPWNPSRQISPKFDLIISLCIIVVILSDKFSSKRILDPENAKFVDIKEE